VVLLNCGNRAETFGEGKESLLGQIFTLLQHGIVHNLKRQLQIVLISTYGLFQLQFTIVLKGELKISTKMDFQQVFVQQGVKTGWVNGQKFSMS
jgi:hypothetical protein